MLDIRAYPSISVSGYGNIAPVTPAGRVFCIVFAIVGIPFTLSVIADVGQICANVVSAIYEKYKPFYKRCKKMYKKWKKNRRKKKGYMRNLVSPCLFLMTLI